MICPKCGHENQLGCETCLLCGVIFAKIKPRPADLELAPIGRLSQTLDDNCIGDGSGIGHQDGSFSGDIGQIGYGAAQIGYGLYNTAEDTAVDIYGAAIGQVSHLYTFPRDIGLLGSAMGSGDVGDILSAFSHTLQDLIIPRYGHGGGAGWGLDKYHKHIWGPKFAALNGTDEANYSHDRHQIEHKWVKEQWTPNNSYRASGPFAVGYKVLGTVGFGVAGYFDPDKP